MRIRIVEDAMALVLLSHMVMWARHSEKEGRKEKERARETILNLLEHAPPPLAVRKNAL